MILFLLGKTKRDDLLALWKKVTLAAQYMYFKQVWRKESVWKLYVEKTYLPLRTAEATFTECCELVALCTTIQILHFYSSSSRSKSSWDHYGGQWDVISCFFSPYPPQRSPLTQRKHSFTPSRPHNLNIRTQSWSRATFRQPRDTFLRRKKLVPKG